MLVLHAHWQSPRSPADPGGVVFWAETPEGEPPPWQRGRLAQNPKPRMHPFCALPGKVRLLLGHTGRLAFAEDGQVTLRLPTTRSGPQPSPLLAHSWELDEETAPFLAPWTVVGAFLPPALALLVLIRLPSLADDHTGSVRFVLAADAQYWHAAASLVLETLAAQKLAPVLAEADPNGSSYHARWLPVLDEPKDGVRLALLERAMPPVCRAEMAEGSSRKAARVEDAEMRLTSRALLDSFVKTACDALARSWGAKAGASIKFHMSETSHRWLAALVSSNPQVRAGLAPLQALAMGQRAWLRYLNVAGDAAFRIAFRLEAPAQQEHKAAGWQLHYLLQARDDPSLLVTAETVWKTRSAALTHLNHRFEQPQEKLLAGLGYAGRMFPPVSESLKGKRPTGIVMDTQQAYTFLRETAPLLDGAGFGVLTPPWWNKPGSRLGVRLRVSARGKSVDNISQSRLTLDNLVHYDWELSLGDTTLTEDEFRSLAALKSPLVQIRGQWVQLDAEQIETAIQFWKKQEMSGEFGLLDALKYSLGGQDTRAGLPVDEVVADGWLAEWLERLKQPEALSELPQPAGLNGELRPYQRYGYSWLAFLRRWRLGACLADDMGLGKTIQTIALLLYEKETSGSLPAPTLLLCPTSVVSNWEREVQRFAPSLVTMVHQGASRLRGDDFLQAARAVDLVLTSYALVRQDAELLQSIRWLGVILDEAQNIKNPSSKQTQSVRKLSGDFRLALTGTPVENRLSELWSIMHFLNPGFLGVQKGFRSDYAIPIERYNDKEATQRLKNLVSPFILRRVKTDPRVIQDLPEKIEMKVYCHLTEEQATLYEAVVQDTMKQVEASEGVQRRGLVLSMLMQLKQICNHPVQYLHQGSKASGGVSDLAERSGKLERLVEMLEEILSAGDRTLIFTQFAEMGEVLAGYLPQATGGAVQFLHGGVPAKQRDLMVKHFQDDAHGPPIFVLSLKAGGVGLNLTRANHVFHFDRWWNPAVEDQATDRAFRIGQQRNVQVHKFVTTGTMEEMIDEMIESKKGLAQAVIGAGEQWLTELSTAQLRELVTLRKQ